MPAMTSRTKLCAPKPIATPRTPAPAITGRGGPRRRWRRVLGPTRPVVRTLSSSLTAKERSGPHQRLSLTAELISGQRTKEPLMRIEVSIPGIRKERGKLPADNTRSAEARTIARSWTAGLRASRASPVPFGDWRRSWRTCRHRARGQHDQERHRPPPSLSRAEAAAFI
jgi:hypothetical protein